MEVNSIDGESPAARAIRLLGVHEIADACSITVSAVYKWKIRGGLVPARYQARVLGLGRRQGVDLSPNSLMGVAA